jgi:hypothetical protein
MRIQHALTTGAVGALVIAGCAGSTPGYSRTNPSQVTCGCEPGDACFEAAGHLASSRGETEETAEELLYLAQCACFQGTVGGCNTVSHYAKDYVAACEADREPRTSCTIAGFVHHHGVAVPRLNGRSFPPDQAAALAAFDKACRAGSPVACQHTPK